MRKITLKSRVEHEFFARVPYEIIINLKNSMSLIKLTKATTCAYNSIVTGLPKLEKKGIIKTKIVGARKIVELTDNGKQIRACLLQMRDYLNKSKGAEE